MLHFAKQGDYAFAEFVTFSAEKLEKERKKERERKIEREERKKKTHAL